MHLGLHLLILASWVRSLARGPGNPLRFR
ncbi:hypothetical protein RSAG8_05376, partial [Rhizoctonia solani AG-8 WAC10335]